MIKKFRKGLKWLILLLLIGSMVSLVTIGLNGRYGAATRRENGDSYHSTSFFISSRGSIPRGKTLSIVKDVNNENMITNSETTLLSHKTPRLSTQQKSKMPDATEAVLGLEKIYGRRKSSLRANSSSTSSQKHQNKILQAVQQQHRATLRTKPQDRGGTSTRSTQKKTNTDVYVPKRRINSIKTTPNTRENESSTEKPRGFVTALEFWDQQTFSIQNIMSLQAWAGLRGVRVLEPFLMGTKFGLPLGDQEAFHSNGSVSYLVMSDVYDLDQWNRECSAYNSELSPLVPWREFLNSAPRNVKFIHFDTWISSNKKGSVGLDKSLEKIGFRLISRQDIALRHQNVQTDSKLESQVYNGTSPDEWTVVFSCWNRMDLPRVSMGINFNMLTGRFVVSLKPSKRVEEDAKCYQISQRTHNTSYIGILVRSEWLIMNRGYNEVRKGILQGCLKKAMDWVKVMKSTYGISAVTVGMDIGKYGSTTLKDLKMDYVKELAENFLKSVYDDPKITLKDWEGSFVNASSSRVPGYVAFLQKYLAVQGRCLLLVGTGSFHNHALQAYTKLHPPHEQCYLRTDTQCNVKFVKGLDILQSITKH